MFIGLLRGEGPRGGGSLIGILRAPPGHPKDDEKVTGSGHVPGIMMWCICYRVLKGGVSKGRECSWGTLRIPFGKIGNLREH